MYIKVYVTEPEKETLSKLAEKKNTSLSQLVYSRLLPLLHDELADMAAFDSLEADTDAALDKTYTLRQTAAYTKANRASIRCTVAEKRTAAHLGRKETDIKAASGIKICAKYSARKEEIMTAICKTKLIHGTNLQPLLDYGENQEKTSYTENALKDTLDYAANPLKTLADMDDGDKELLVSGVLCEPSTALWDFAAVREKYLEIHGSERIYCYEYFDKRTGETRNARRDPVTAIHLIQSFSEKNLDPRTVHQIGIELCNKLGVMAVVDTHMNTDHLHNHIIINAYLPGGERKFVMETATIIRIRELSDQFQQEHGIELKFDTPMKQLN